MTTRRTIAFAGVLLLVASVAWAHDLFLKLDTYYLEPRARVRIPVVNGTFTKSEGFVAPERIADISVVSSAGRTQLQPSTAWGRGPDSASVLTIDVGDAGTYVVGVATRPRELQLKAEDFNAYLEEDGLPDVLDARRRNNEIGRSAHERYSKYVKAIIQVGAARTSDFGATFGYAAEIVPMENPYSTERGALFRVRCLVDGRPIGNQTVLWGGERDGRLFAQRSTRTDSAGVATITLDAAGRWYVKFIRMTRSAEAGLDYESKWATLTFETR